MKTCKFFLRKKDFIRSIVCQFMTCHACRFLLYFNTIKVYLFIILVTLLTILANFSCIKNPDKLEQSLILAGKNRYELEKVLEYFKNDSLKYQAACFLIKNMSNKYSIDGQKYHAYRDTILKYYKDTRTLEIIFGKMKGKYTEDIIPDITSITAGYLISNIEQAFSMYYQSQWFEEISFNNFLENILPYRIGNEPLEDWRTEINALEDSSIHNYIPVLSAATYMIKELSEFKKDFAIRWGEKNPGIIDIPFSLLNRIPVGSCKELSEYISFVLRAYAVPCAIDFTPNYANVNSGHTWNAILISYEKSIPFVFPLKIDTLGRYKIDHYKLPKVYRNTYSANPLSHAAQRGYCKFLPDLFNDHNIIDVTEVYVPVCNIQIPLDKNYRPMSKFVYFAVFDNKNWIPIGWGIIKKNNAFFDQLGIENVYLPIAIEKKGTSYINYPFIPFKDGHIKTLKPDTDSLITLNLLRKYPLFPNIETFINRMVGGEFQGANKPDFSDAFTLYKIEKSPGEYFNNIDIDVNKKFRYVRYHGAKGSFCNIAELVFYADCNNNNPLIGEVIGTDGSYGDNPERTREKVFDGNVLTFFDAPLKDSAWVGLDLEHPQNIGSIRFIARTDYNIIVEDNLYEVFYWDNQWISLGKKTATSHILTYENVPSNALYFIKNHTSGKEEWIFTYESGNQIWW